MLLTNTIWLWGLVGLLIPVVIHFLSRKAGKVIRFGSVRHLEDTSTKQFKSVRLNEMVLLALRCLFIVCLVLLLSGIQFNSSEKNNRWLLIESGLENDSEFASLIDSLKNNSFEIRFLVQGFPYVGDSIPIKKVSYWDLVDDVKDKSFEQVIILSYSYMEGYKGKRTVLPDYVQWLSKDPDSVEYALNAFKYSEDSVNVRLGTTNFNRTFYYTRKTTNTEAIRSVADTITIGLPDTISIAVVYDADFSYDKNIVEAALKAVEKITPHRIFVKAVPTEQYSNIPRRKWIVWLSQTPPPGNQHIIRIYNGELGSKDLLLQTKNIHGTVTWLLTRRLNEEVALRENLAVELALILLPKEKNHRENPQMDRRVLPEQIRWSNKPDKSSHLQAGIKTTSGENFLAIALFVILLSERLLAFKRDQ